MKLSKYPDFDPNGVALENGNFLGFPFDYSDSKMILVPVPWDVTVSYHEGTAAGPQNIINSSYQLEVFQEKYPTTWQQGIFAMAEDPWICEKAKELRKLSKEIIVAQERGDDISSFSEELDKVNSGCAEMNDFVYHSTKKMIGEGKVIGLIGGDHSTPLGYYRALKDSGIDFGIVQFDAHLDLREKYEHFNFSHASIFYNVLQENLVNGIYPVGIRDFCEQEWSMAMNDDRVHPLTMSQINESLFEGKSFKQMVDEWISRLPSHVHISFDIDGLDPTYCPHTGTPVPGGLTYQQAIYILRRISKSPVKVIGFDLCEVNGHHDYDGTVGARLAYELMLLSLIK